MRIAVDALQPLAGEAFAGAGEVIRLYPEEITNSALRRADALVCRSTVKVTPELLADTAVRFVGTCTIGFDHIDCAYLDARQIGFSAAPGCNSDSVGEYITAALLTYAVEKGVSLQNKTLGIIGAGNVGKAVARRAKALRMRVLLNDPPRARAEGAAGFMELPELLRESDFVSLHVPLNKSGDDRTLGMADEKFFAAMKPGAVFINASRGKVVWEDALAQALDGGRLAAAILDVWASEPHPDPELVKKCFIATPHIAGHSYDGKVNGTAIIYNAFCHHFGMTPAWKPDVAMPELAVTRIDIQSDAAFEVELLDAVSAVYDIRADHRRFTANPDDFSRLRKTYPQRMEFSHTVASAPNSRPDLCAGLAGIGFAPDTGFSER